MAKGAGVVNNYNLDRQKDYAKLDSTGVSFRSVTVTEAAACTIEGDLNGIAEMEFYLGETAGVNAIGAFSVTVDFYENDDALTGAQQVVATGGVAAGQNKYVTITGSEYAAKATRYVATFTLPHSGSDYTASVCMSCIGSSSDTTASEVIQSDASLLNMTETNSSGILTAVQTLSDAIYVDSEAFTRSSSKTLSIGGIVNPTVSQTDNDITPIAVDEQGNIWGATDDRVATATRYSNIFPHNLKEKPNADLIDLTNSTATTTAYLDMEGYSRLDLQYTVTTGACTLTVETSLQDDGTASPSCLYWDATNEVFGATAFTATTTLFDDAQVLGGAKYVKVKVVTVAGTCNVHARRKA